MNTAKLPFPTSFYRHPLDCANIVYKKPSYRWGTARRGRASWNLV